MIRFDSVTKRYPDGTLAVDDLSFTAPTGKITVLVGPSGCGKTTSLRMINRLIEPTSGTIWIDDRDASQISATQLRRGIGYVIQHAGLFPHRTIVDNVATVPILLGTPKKQARMAALELMERVGLDPMFANRYPAQLSGGQQQRVGVARALASDPPVMLMDEPFSAVDPVVRAQLHEEFLRLQSDLGKTIIMVTHDIDEAVKLGDQIAVLQVGGHLAQLASPHELLTRPVNDFVADFVGRDRGYRSLSFEKSGSLPTRGEPTVELGSEVSAARALAIDDWILVANSDGKPLGWLCTSLAPAGAVREDMLFRGGTIAASDGTLRQALDATLSSPSGRGVIVTPDGVLIGTVTATEVVERITTNAGDARAEHSSSGSPAGATQ
ncbi:ATP-binding cassette domain-containing protein [Nakamurella antarctica]|uniref:ABC-type quaternary amine transporter n=1 Tax=Nakamurella antarctica TaxID=1902245 RepID=A0A3G8ZMQ2_9ACTN|nr:ATP-binding cassette domain-containing protein [Nakamurella antarctica]AZI58599.1 ATP-binding cassette domain-containing protein [Nakamurella antarctica]